MHTDIHNVLTEDEHEQHIKYMAAYYMWQFYTRGSNLAQDGISHPLYRLIDAVNNLPADSSRYKKPCHFIEI